MSPPLSQLPAGHPRLTTTTSPTTNKGPGSPEPGPLLWPRSAEGDAGRKDAAPGGNVDFHVGDSGSPPQHLVQAIVTGDVPPTAERRRQAQALQQAAVPGHRRFYVCQAAGNEYGCGRGSSCFAGGRGGLGDRPASPLPPLFWLLAKLAELWPTEACLPAGQGAGNSRRKSATKERRRDIC